MSECNVENVHVVEKRSIQVAKASMTAQEASGQGASHHGWLLHPRKKKAWKRTNADSFRLWHGSIGFSGGCGCRERLHNCNGVTIMVQDGTTTKKWFICLHPVRQNEKWARQKGWLRTLASGHHQWILRWWEKRCARRAMTSDDQRKHNKSAVSFLSTPFIYLISTRSLYQEGHHGSIWSWARWTTAYSSSNPSDELWWDRGAVIECNSCQCALSRKERSHFSYSTCL